MHILVYLCGNGVHLWRLDLILCSFGGSKWSIRSNTLPFNLLDNDHYLSLCTCLFAWHDQQKDVISALWQYCNRYRQSIVGQVLNVLAGLFYERSGLRSFDELHLHPHHFANKLIWLDPGIAPNKQYHHLQCAWRRRADDGRWSLDAAKITSLLLQSTCHAYHYGDLEKILRQYPIPGAKVREGAGNGIAGPLSRQMIKLFIVDLIFFFIYFVFFIP